ncbi:cytochrome P450 4C1-like [Solenopsis invicta]|uniref:cytochrome P450 4C1-like n=1 Tax=Solenopsis invicta TaxID=13686 RepID=UPI00193DB49D|nr:cytochrome P450 4C1-like [Solenopsis invicta]
MKQDRVRNEIDASMKDTEGKLTESSLQNLKYLEECIQESMRLYPPAPLIARVTSEKAQLSTYFSESYLIPPGTVIFLSIYAVHHDPNFWPNPELFNPDRFTNKNNQKHLYSYIPFSAGQRNCLGQNFALRKMKAVISTLIHNFYLKPVDLLEETQLEVDMLLHPITPRRVTFIPIAK